MLVTGFQVALQEPSTYTLPPAAQTEQHDGGAILISHHDIFNTRTHVTVETRLDSIGVYEASVMRLPGGRLRDRIV